MIIVREFQAESGRRRGQVTSFARKSFTDKNRKLFFEDILQFEVSAITASNTLSVACQPSSFQSHGVIYIHMTSL